MYSLANFATSSGSIEAYRVAMLALTIVHDSFMLLGIAFANRNDRVIDAEMAEDSSFKQGNFWPSKLNDSFSELRPLVGNRYLNIKK